MEKKQIQSFEELSFNMLGKLSVQTFKWNIQNENGQ